MIDIRKIEENPTKVKELLANKLYDVDFDELLAKNKRKKELIAEVESNKAEQNKLSKSVPLWKKEGKDVNELFKQVKELAAQVKDKEAELNELEKWVYDFLKVLPNLPDEDLLPGGKENNKEIYKYKEVPTFDFPIKDHV